MPTDPAIAPSSAHIGTAKLSIVSTLYRSSATVDDFVARSFAVADTLFSDVEMILVNDGSPDDSVAKAQLLQQAEPRLVIVDLSRNFGHHKAIMTGLAHASGDLVFLIDSDLEEEPELLRKFVEKFTEANCDVVYGIQETRKGGFVERITGAVFFYLARLIGDIPLPKNATTVRLMTRQYVRAAIRHREREFTISHIFIMTGFRQVGLNIHKLSNSPTTYSVARRIDIAIRFLTTNSVRSLYVILWAGLAIWLSSIAAIVFFIAQYLVKRVGLDGWTSLIVSVWFFGGLTALILGVQGIYIATILAESRRRPYTIVRSVYRRSK